MIRTKSRDYAWNKGWIEFEAPNAQGVYWLRAKDGQTIFVGKGNIRQRLLSHWDHKKPGDLSIWSRNPATFAFELAAHPADLYAQLLRELKPLCQPAHHSLFFWR